MNMRKLRWVLAAAAALAIVTAAYTETRDNAGAEALTAQAPEPANGKCVTREVPLDEGYSVTRTELRRVCAED